MRAIKFDIRAQRHIYSNTIEIVLIQHDLNGLPVGIAKPLTMERILNEGMICEPTMALLPADAQQLMDELWACGMRPSEGSGSTGSLAATERHLKDMQKIAFGLLKDDGITV